jgi:hypothetical protein
MKVHMIPSEWVEKRKLDAIKNLKYQNSDLLHQMQQSFPATEQPTTEEALNSKPKADSTTIIGDVQEHYKELTKAGYIFDYKSFYNGWIEGRAKLLVKPDKA